MVSIKNIEIDTLTVPADLQDDQTDRNSVVNDF